MKKSQIVELMRLIDKSIKAKYHLLFMTIHDDISFPNEQDVAKKKNDYEILFCNITKHKLWNFKEEI